MENVITLTGNNHFLLKTELDKLVNGFVEEHGDLALERLDGEEVSFARILEAVQSLPFFGSKKMVVLKSAVGNKDLTENIEQVLESATETTDLVMVEPKLDKRTAYFKVLKKRTDFQEFNELDAPGLARWLSNEAKGQSANLKPSDAQYLVERIGTNQQMLSQELNKLVNYRSDITRETINLLTEPSPQSTIFELLDTAFAGNARRAILLYKEQRILRVEPQQIVAMLAWQLHVLAIIKTAGDRSPNEIAARAKLNPFVVRKSQSIARKLGLGDIKKLVQDLLEIDTRLKSEPIDPDEALQNYLLGLSMQ